MGEYLYSLNGKSFKAINSVTNEEVTIAFAPYFTKPNGKDYEWMSNIGQFADESRSLKNQKWVTASEMKEFREKELRCVDIRRPKKESYGHTNYNYNMELFYFQEDSRKYWKLKHRMEKLEVFEKEFDESGVKFVCFIDDIKSIGQSYEGRPIEPVSVFKLNGSLWGDTPTYGTPQMGEVDLINGKIVFTPKV
jgi:hypothetical protein